MPLESGIGDRSVADSGPSEPDRGNAGAPHPALSEADRERALSAIRRTYQEYRSSGYDRRWHRVSPGYQRLIEERDRWLVTAVMESNPRVVVDLGCGSGSLVRAFDAASRRPKRLIGIDLLESRVATAREQGPWGEFHVASADRVPLEESSADVIVASTLLSSLRSSGLRLAVSAEVARLLRPGGRLVVYDIRLPSPRNPAVIPITPRLLRREYPNWRIEHRTLGLLPPLARSPLTTPEIVYRMLTAVPILRSHIGAVLTSPTRPEGEHVLGRGT